MISEKQSVNSIAALDIKTEGMIHDVCYDYFGTKLAASTSDGKIHLYETSQYTSGQPMKKYDTIEAHKGPVWQIGWSNPKFGTLLASCSFDKTLKIWMEQGVRWNCIYEARKDSSINTISWCPGRAYIAAGLAEGLIIIFDQQTGSDYKPFWSESTVAEGHKEGVNSISWLKQEDKLILASGGLDRRVVIWNFQYGVKQLTILKEFSFGHWVRSVDWATEQIQDQIVLAVGLECSQVEVICLKEHTQLVYQKTIKESGPCWKVSWSPLGNQLAISTIDTQGMCQVNVYMQNEKNEFDQI